MKAIALIALFAASTALADLRDHANAALARSTQFMRSISAGGGYLWWYSADLKERAGENRATATQVWVQPPGTPAMGQAFLRAYRVTKDRAYLDAALAAADALAYGQLESGGWHYMIDFDAAADRYLRRAIARDLPDKERARRKNVTTFDDNVTQSCIVFLLDISKELPQANDERSARIRSALDYALEKMLAAQYPNGAWPQGYMGQARPAAEFPVIAASVPEDYRQLPHIKEYWWHYTLNDQTHRDCIRTMLEAHRITGQDQYLAAARKGGDFLILAQLPAPQPAWAQQYDPQMRPAWARKFEPPSVCSNESAGAIRTLVELYLHTGDEKYLKPIPPAIQWLKRVRLPEGTWARFYELKTDKPLYFTTAYELVYTDTDLPTHYGFKGGFGIESAAAFYERVKEAGREKWIARKPGPKNAAALAPRVQRIIAALDTQGRWLDKDQRIRCGDFIDNVNLLCDYLESTAP